MVFRLIGSMFGFGKSRKPEPTVNVESRPEIPEPPAPPKAESSSGPLSFDGEGFAVLDGTRHFPKAFHSWLRHEDGGLVFVSHKTLKLDDATLQAIADGERLRVKWVKAPARKRNDATEVTPV